MTDFARDLSSANSKRSKMLTASIVTFHTEAQELLTCLDSLDSGMFDTIYVIDNGQEPRIKEIANRHSAPTRYIPLPNPGYGAAHNTAMRLALQRGATHHLIVNTDIRFGPEVIPSLMHYFSEHPETGMLHPRMVDEHGNLQMSVRMLPTPWDLILRRFLPSGWFTKRRQTYLLAHISHSQPFTAPYLEGSFMLVNMKAIEECGGFDERFFMYPEDIDLTRRIYALRPTVYYPIVTVTHLHRRASYRSWRMLKIHCVNMIKYFNKWGWFYDPERKKANAILSSKGTSHS